RQPQPDNAGLFNTRKGHQSILNRRRRHILALLGFENFLQTPRDTQTPLAVDLAHITGAQPVTISKGFTGLLLLTVVALHIAGAANLDFATVTDAAFHTLIGL